jgi:hypothetical protein
MVWDGEASADTSPGDEFAEGNVSAEEEREYVAPAGIYSEDWKGTTAAETDITINADDLYELAGLYHNEWRSWASSSSASASPFTSTRSGTSHAHSEQN